MNISEALIPLRSNDKASRIYWRDTMGALPPTTNRSAIYSRSQARQIFAMMPHVVMVEYVDGGRKMDSQILKRGDGYAPKGCYIIVSSTGGTWGKSRRDFAPHK